MHVKKTLLCTAALMLLAACHPDTRELNQANVTKAMNAYLETRGDLCLAKSSWPIDVAADEAQGGSRNGLQMPALEKLGLVAGSEVRIARTAEDGSTSTVAARRYRLTDAGSKYYLPRAAHKRPSGNRFAEADHDFCAARLSLDQVLGWEMPGGNSEAVVTYTYKIAPAPWTSDAGVRQVFPMVDRVIRGAGVLELKEVLVRTDSGWEAKDL
jgi:hypothetical protein